jgi:hypothetical protein
VPVPLFGGDTMIRTSPGFAILAQQHKKKGGEERDKDMGIFKFVIFRIC